MSPSRPLSRAAAEAATLYSPRSDPQSICLNPTVKLTHDDASQKKRKEREDAVTTLLVQVMVRRTLFEMDFKVLPRVGPYTLQGVMCGGVRVYLFTRTSMPRVTL